MASRYGKNVTSQYAYRQPIIDILNRFPEKKCRIAAVKKLIPSLVRLAKDDWTRTIGAGNPFVWWNRAQFERFNMVQDGTLASNSPKGIWELATVNRKVKRKPRAAAKMKPAPVAPAAIPFPATYVPRMNRAVTAVQLKSDLNAKAGEWLAIDDDDNICQFSPEQFEAIYTTEDVAA